MMEDEVVAKLINQLFEIHWHPSCREYTHLEVTLATEDQIKPTHLSKLRNGGIKNPTWTTLLALCQFFGVKPAYFFPEQERSGRRAGPSALM